MEVRSEVVGSLGAILRVGVARERAELRVVEQATAPRLKFGDVRRA